MNYYDALAIDFRAEGKKGDVVVSIAKLFVYRFRGEKFIATDDFLGTDTRILQIYVNDEPCFPLSKRYLNGEGIPTRVFAPEALGNGLCLPDCEAGQEIAIEVGFLRTGKWRGKLFGSKV